MASGEQDGGMTDVLGLKVRGLEFSLLILSTTYCFTVPLLSLLK